MSVEESVETCHAERAGMFDRKIATHLLTMYPNRRKRSFRSKHWSASLTGCDDRSQHGNVLSRVVLQTSRAI